ncbi:MAG: hypothetical protein OEZ51_11240 [Nitrospinota bacterium]|nr:hypothetical protein [Nitrospinota bacterium]
MKPTAVPNHFQTAQCSECGTGVARLPTVVEFDGQEVHVFDPVFCASCLLSLCERYSVDCANCGGKIPPYSQVGVLKTGTGTSQFVHMTTACSTVGSAFHGYLGKGSLGDFYQVEAC